MASTYAVRARTIILVVVACAGLIIDAVVHLSLAAEYDANRGSLLSQGDLFRIEAAVALFAALVLLVSRGRTAWLLSLVVSGSALAAVLVYRYADIGSIGPLPDMYEPFWFDKKLLATFAEGATVAASAVGLFLAFRSPRTRTLRRPRVLARSSTHQ